MPKNKGSGGKNRRKGKGSGNQPRELIFKEEEQEYGQIIKSIGNGFMDVMCFTSTGNIQRRAHIRGNMRKRVWMAPGDIVLVSTREFQDGTCDLILKYTPDEARILRNRNELPENIDINKNDTAPDDSVVFGKESDDESDDEPKEKSKIPQQTRNLDLPPIDEDNVNIDDL